jgi:hypothetical protein
LTSTTTSAPSEDPTVLHEGHRDLEGRGPAGEQVADILARHQPGVQGHRPRHRRVEVGHLRPLLVGDQRLDHRQDAGLGDRRVRWPPCQQAMDEASDQAAAGRLVVVVPRGLAARADADGGLGRTERGDRGSRDRGLESGCR